MKVPDVVRLHPPLTIDDELLEKGLSIMDEVFKNNLALFLYAQV